ncbi:Bifunctional protein HldE [Luteitalea pratensis]|uniref:Bifunctional protein HldE n=1 Tax=Luteitalea pratensis TaxID=1855912 RepID=A0A143PUA2_LUTPR|nr:PfkB family carbohydrate kinase [Luteitalea pratensis]AMY11670.1 Bifunctional protein HldE [Luteitalea pratensis]
MTHAIGQARARSLIHDFSGRRVVVVGDVMLDHFLFGRVQRLSPEAPVPIVEYDHDDYRPGGAANVAMNLAALGASVSLIGVVGADDSAGGLQQLLADGSVDVTDLVTDDTRRTTRKLRIVTQRQQQVARVDFENDADINGAVADQVKAAIDARCADADIVLVSDYLKGVVTSVTMAAVVQAAAPRRIAVLVDPKIPHLDLYRGVTLVTPNQVEAETATHARIRTDSEARDAARRLRERLECASVVITRGEQGMWVLDGSTTPATEANFAATALEVSDVTGAGDTVIGTLALALAAKASLVEAAQLATLAAGVAVSRFGPVAVTRDELLARLA